MTRPSLKERFWQGVDRRGLDECWVWQRSTNPQGYGLIRVGERKKVGVHRLSYEIHVGPIPEGMVVDHLCRNRACVNPYHLEVVTNRVNVLRGLGASAQHARKTQCPQGHEYDATNSVGARICRQCKKEQHRAWHQRQLLTVSE